MGNAVVICNDLYQDESPSKPGYPPIGTGRNAVIEGAIIEQMRGSETSP
jgi:hypothetical protein